MTRLAGVLFVAFSCPLLCAQTERVRVWQDTLTLPTYREDPPSGLPPFDQFEIGGAGNYSIYPYAFRQNMTSRKYDAAWRVLNLENQYLHCLVLPDLGGHLYTCRDKLSGKDMFYANTAIKKHDTAPRGAWVAGGIETSFPIAHSRLTVSPVHFATTANDDGSGTVYVAAIDRISGMEWRVAYTLRPGIAVLEESVWLNNPGVMRQPYQWWSNAALRLPEGGHQLTYPMWVTAPHGAGVLDTWPVNQAGVDLSKTANYATALGVFSYGSREPFFAAYDPKSQTGVSHWADPREVPAKKVWVYGKDLTYQTDLSDDHSGYTEIQAGLLTTQDMMEFLQPQQSRSFTELWIPSRGTGGITRATPEAVLFLKREPQEGGNVKAAVDLNVTRLLPHATLTITRNGKTVWQQQADLDPAMTFHAASDPVEAGGKFRFELKNAAGQVLLAHDEGVYDAVTPAEVKIGAPIPSAAPKPASAEQQSLSDAEGDELVRLLDRAAARYDGARSSYPKSRAARKAAGRFLILFRRFADAAEVLAPLQREDASDAETSYYLGVARSELGDDAAARPLWQAILKDPGFGPAAQDRLACALARAGEWDGALEMMHTLAARGPGRAAAVEVAILRHRGRAAEAQAAVKKALAADPVDSLLRVEAISLLGREDPGLWENLAADPEWVLDVADEYLDAGLYQEAIAVLEHDYPAVGELQTEPAVVHPQDDPLISYYRGYARQRLGQSAAADFLKASEQSTLYVFPYRASSFRVLQAAIAADAADATAHYLLGCLLYNSRSKSAALAEFALAKPAASRIPAYDETVARIRGTFTAATAAQTAATSFASPAEAAAQALIAAGNNDFGGAAAIFQAKNFPDDKVPVEVRQAYAEVALRTLLVSAGPGKCEQVTAAIEDFAPENAALRFTFHGFGDFAKQLRFQYYFGVAESLCGDRKAANRRWSKIAKAKAATSSADYVFPFVATALVDPAGSQRTVEAALQTVAGSGGPEEKGLRLYAEGMLFRVVGRTDEAQRRFEEGAKDAKPYTRFLHQSAQHDPALPK